MINYVYFVYLFAEFVEKYGRRGKSQVITFSTLHNRQQIQNVILFQTLLHTRLSLLPKTV
jgi:DNA polymerase III alpha subunit